MTFRRYFICFVLSMLVSISTAVFAGDPPNKLNYQGILTNSTGQPVTGSVTVTFRLYNALTGGTAIWSEPQSVALANDGRFSVVLGSTTPLYPGLFTGVTYIGVKVGNDAEMPRQQLTSVAYALNANTATTAITAQKSLDTVQIPKGVIVMWNGTLATIPAGWALCDGELHEGIRTPNLKDKFVVGVGSDFTVGATGGTKTIDISHSHSIAADSPGTNYVGDHQHSYSGTTSINSNTDKRSKSDDLQDTGGSVHNHTYSGVTSVSGGHTHTVNAHSHYGATGVAGTTTLDKLPPYYALAYIMKL